MMDIVVVLNMHVAECAWLIEVCYDIGVEGRSCGTCQEVGFYDVKLHRFVTILYSVRGAVSLLLPWKVPASQGRHIATPV